MLDRISTTLVPCFLANLKWELFHQFADEFMGAKVEQVQADLNNLLIKNTRCTLQAHRYTVSPTGLPWNIEANLSFSRNPGPIDLWLGVQFAKEICMATGAQSFCNIPAEVIVPDTNYYWQLTFYLAPNNLLISDVIQFKKIGNELVKEVKSQSVDLRNYELFQTILPYR